MHHSINHFLEQQNNTSKLFKHASLITRLENCFLQVVGNNSDAYVANYRAQSVVIHASNSLQATKLRQMQNRLLSAFLNVTPDCNAIVIKIQPLPTNRQQLKQPALPFNRIYQQKQIRPLSLQVRAQLQSLINNIDSQSLSDTIENLLQHSATKD